RMVLRPEVPAPRTALGARALSQALQVRRGIRRSAVALRAPQRFGQALDRFVQRVVSVAVPGEERAQALPDSRRLVDGELLLQRDMQAHVQEGIRFADVVPVAVARRQLQYRVVLGVQQDHVEGERLHAGERLAVTIFAPGAEKKLARLIARRIKHPWSSA